ncbi:hypothetical protein EBR21_04380 [bacterium]|nr:hypothetical protein [bacterium]
MFIAFESSEKATSRSLDIEAPVSGPRKVTAALSSGVFAVIEDRIKEKIESAIYSRQIEAQMG